VRADTSNDSRSRLVLTTSRLLWRQGLHGTGLQQILAESQSPRGSLYFYFPGGKEDLAVEAVQVAARLISSGIRKMLERVNMADALRSFVDMFAGEMRRSDFEQGCPVATVTLEATPESEALRVVCEEAYNEWESLIAARLEEDGFSRRRAAQLATLTLSTVEGALLLSRARRNSEPLETIRELLVPLLQKPRR